MSRPYHWFWKALFGVYAVAILWTSVASAIESRQTSSLTSHSNAGLRVIYMPHTAVRAYVQSAARAAGVDPRVAEWIVAHESGHRPEVTGDGGASRGLWQINKAWHPEVSDACAYSIACSTHWSLQRIRSGYADEWSTWRDCKTRFDDCPTNGPLAERRHEAVRSAAKSLSDFPRF